MDSELRKRARSLAGRPYIELVAEDQTTEGKPVYLASTPELPGCMAQGATEQEALENLLDARTEYILSLLKDDLPVPAPFSKTLGTSGSTVPPVVFTVTVSRSRSAS